MIQIPKLKAKFFGTGDLFAATFLAWMSKTDNNLNIALENTVATVGAVITRTLNEYKGMLSYVVKKIYPSKFAYAFLL